VEAGLTHDPPDRRCSTRVDRHQIRSARIRPGDAAVVVNISVTGVLLETRRRLLPGAAVEVQMETDTDRTTIRGRVLRCAVSDLRAAGVAYRGAILFDRHLPWFADETSASTPDQRPGRPERAPATQTVI
jgi:hypothetical protein